MFKKIVLFSMLLFALKVSAQTDKATTTRIVNEKNYVFVATDAVPMNSMDINNIMSKMPGASNGANISLTGANYDVQISPNSLIAYLPFYGRAYSAPVGSEDGGYRFTAKDFTYTTKARKRGGWEIEMITKDVRDNVRMNLTISENGYGTLNVFSNNRQSITYNGYLSEPKRPKT